jgi:hypothetical protein
VTARDADEVDDQRMAAVMDALAEVVDATARRERVRLPVVKPAEAAALARALHAEMDGGVEARDEAIAAAGRHLACGRGCSACCEVVIMTYEPEALAVARWLARPEQASARAHFAAAYRSWRAAVGDLADRARDSASRGDAAGVGAAAGEAGKRRVLCAFNRDGDCTIYPVRPNLCRGCHALDTAASCVADNPLGERPVVMHFAPIDDFMDRVRPLSIAAHAALRGSAAPEPLCDSVHRLLTPSKVGRNDPCPCGSGVKHKRCCG